MARRFALDISKFVEKTKGDLDVITRKVIMGIGNELIEKSPVDTGRFRANWVYGEGKINYTVVEEFAVANGRANAQRALLASLPQRFTATMHYISNSLPYAERLEDGHSKQAPSGMVGITMINWQNDLARKISEVK